MFASCRFSVQSLLDFCTISFWLCLRGCASKEFSCTTCLLRSLILTSRTLSGSICLHTVGGSVHFASVIGILKWLFFYQGLNERYIDIFLLSHWVLSWIMVWMRSVCASSMAKGVTNATSHFVKFFITFLSFDVWEMVQHSILEISRHNLESVCRLSLY